MLCLSSKVSPEVAETKKKNRIRTVNFEFVYFHASYQSNVLFNPIKLLLLSLILKLMAC